VADAVWRRVEAAPYGAHTRYTHAEVRGGDSYEGVVPAYFRVARVATVDPILLIAMMLHETGNMSSWQAAKPRRNPAGIFVTGATRTSLPPAREGDLWQAKGALWVRGQAYPNWVSSPAFPWRPNSVDAHAWRVAGYAIPRFSNAQEALYVRACQGRPLPLWVRGSALNWRELGAKFNRMRLLGGGWANPGDHYGEAVAAIANAITAGAW